MTIEDTEDLLRVLKKQMTMNGRISDGKLTIWLSFGRAQLGEAFVDQEEFNTYRDTKEYEKFPHELLPTEHRTSETPSWKHNAP